MKLSLEESILEQLEVNNIDYSVIDPPQIFAGEINIDKQIKIALNPHEIGRMFEIIEELGFVHIRGLPNKKSGCYAEYLGADTGTGQIHLVSLYARSCDEMKKLDQVTGRNLRAKISEVFRKFGLIRSRKKFLAPSGKIFAFMGGDGSGKTSNIREFQNWFGQYFNVRVLHVGKPAKGPMWYGIGVLLKLRKTLLRIRTDNFHESVKYLMVAWYRRRTFLRAVSLRSRGFLVALDRFPLPGMEIMEAPQIERLTGGGGIYDFMARLECKFHHEIRGADEIFALMVDPAIARIRRPEDKPQELKRRCCEILHRDWPEGYAHLIDASRPFDEVVSEIRRLAWNSLNKTVRVVEIVGPAGVGKTSVANKLKESTNSVQTSVSWHDSKWCLMKILFKRWANIANLLLQNVPADVLKEVVGLEVDLEILLKHKKRHLLSCREVFLEVGPIFKLSKLKMEGYHQSIKWIDEINEKINRALDGLIWMDSSNEILRQRVNMRAKNHEMKNAKEEEIFQFFDDYRKCFSEVIDSFKGNFAVNHLDITSMNVEEVAGAIRQVAFRST